MSIAVFAVVMKAPDGDFGRSEVERTAGSSGLHVIYPCLIYEVSNLCLFGLDDLQTFFLIFEYMCLLF